ncbi:RrF2 family transcriptional regulator [Candidatus Omnitrophota bacterium]
MKLITRDTDYAFRALCSMAGSRKKIISADELVHETKVPRPFLRKILQRLNKEGIVRSHKGKGGGFTFARSTKKIYLADIIKIFQGPIRLNDHTFKKKKCPEIERCKIKQKIDKVEQVVERKLKKISIASIIRRK